MMRIFFHTFLFLFVVALEFGFLHSFDGLVSLTPLVVSVGIYYVFQMRFKIGLSWLIGAGAVSDLLAYQSVFQTVIAAFVGIILIYFVQQHITHSSVYAVWFSGFLVIFAWMSAVVLISGVLYGFSAMFDEFSFIFYSAFLGGFLAGFWALVIPRITSAVYSVIRFNI